MPYFSYRNWTLLLSFFFGFVSLGEEMLWFRIIGFVSAGSALTNSIVLGTYLLGIAIGANYGTKILSRLEKYDTAMLYMMFSWTIIIGITIDLIVYMSTPLWIKLGDAFLTLLLPLISAATKAYAFPICHHLTTQKTQKHSSFSLTYALNIAGATLGGLLTTFVFLNLFNTHHSFLILNLILALVAMLLIFESRCDMESTYVSSSHFKKLEWLWVFQWIFAILFAIVASFGNILPYIIHYTHPKGIDVSTLKVYENNKGIIHTAQDKHGITTIFGGNAYDGKINTDFNVTDNGLSRLFLPVSFNRTYHSILVIGLSGGAWTKVLSHYPDVKTIDVVELNNQYLDVIKDNPSVSDITSKSFIHYYWEDGRQFVKRTSKKYDLIVMNTTFHWRLYTSNLLSSEFMSLLQKRLTTDGVLIFNTTKSKDAFFTVANQFQESYQYLSFAYASNSPIYITDLNKISTLNVNIGHHPVEKTNEWSEQFKSNWKPLKKEKENTKSTLITDDNLYSEYNSFISNQ